MKIILLAALGIVLLVALAACGPDRSTHGDHEDHNHAGNDHGSHVEKDDHDDHGEEDSYASRDHGEEGILELSDEQLKEANLRVERATSGSLTSKLSLTGEIRINEDNLSHLVPRVAGLVSRVKVSVGDNVAKDQILATLQSSDLAEAEADYLDKERRLEIAKKAYDRMKYLHDEQIASEAAWLDAEGEFLIAETALRTARRKLGILGFSDAEIESLHDRPDDRFGIYELRSPRSGTVIEKHITQGEKLNADSPVLTIADLADVWVDLKVSKRDVARIEIGTEITVESADGHQATAVINLIGPVVDEETRTVLVRAMMENPGNRWKPGTFVMGHTSRTDVSIPVVVPADAVQNIEGNDVVFLPEGHGYKPVPVKTGRRNSTHVEITFGLRPGTDYVSEGAFNLKAVMITSSLGSHAGHGH